MYGKQSVRNAARSGRYVYRSAGRARLLVQIVPAWRACQVGLRFGCGRLHAEGIGVGTVRSASGSSRPRLGRCLRIPRWRSPSGCRRLVDASNRNGISSYEMREAERHAKDGLVYAASYREMMDDEPDDQLTRNGRSGRGLYGGLVGEEPRAPRYDRLVKADGDAKTPEISNESERVAFALSVPNVRHKTLLPS